MRRAPSSMMADLPLLVRFHSSKVSYILRFMAVPLEKRAYCTMLHMATSRAEWSISRDSIGLNLHVFKGFAKRKSTRFQMIRTTRLLISLYIYRYSHLLSLISHLSSLFTLYPLPFTLYSSLISHLSLLISHYSSPISSATIPLCEIRSLSWSNAF